VRVEIIPSGFDGDRSELGGGLSVGQLQESLIEAFLVDDFGGSSSGEQRENYNK
jgi:hypothetical protein